MSKKEEKREKGIKENLGEGIRSPFRRRRRRRKRRRKLLQLLSCLTHTLIKSLVSEYLSLTSYIREWREKTVRQQKTKQQNELFFSNAVFAPHFDSVLNWLLRETVSVESQCCIFVLGFETKARNKTTTKKSTPLSLVSLSITLRVTS